MEKFSFIIVPRYRMQGMILKSAEGNVVEVWGENSAIRELHRLYRELSLHKVLMLDEHFNIVFKIERRCKCTNVQWHISGELKCMDCNLLISKITPQIEVPTVITTLETTNV